MCLTYTLLFSPVITRCRQSAFDDRQEQAIEWRCALREGDPPQGGTHGLLQRLRHVLGTGA